MEQALSSKHQPWSAARNFRAYFISKSGVFARVFVATLHFERIRDKCRFFLAVSIGRGLWHALQTGFSGMRPIRTMSRKTPC